MGKSYPVADFVKVRNSMHRGPVRAVLTGERRSPRKGEWYLSGAIPEAYYASADLKTEYYICRIHKAAQTTKWELGEEL